MFDPSNPNLVVPIAYLSGVWPTLEPYNLSGFVPTVVVMVAIVLHLYVPVLGPVGLSVVVAVSELEV